MCVLTVYRHFFFCVCIKYCLFKHHCSNTLCLKLLFHRVIQCSFNIGISLPYFVSKDETFAAQNKLFIPATVLISACTKQLKWTGIHLYVRGINFASCLRFFLMDIWNVLTVWNGCFSFDSWNAFLYIIIRPRNCLLANRLDSYYDTHSLRRKIGRVLQHLRT